MEFQHRFSDFCAKFLSTLSFVSNFEFLLLWNCCMGFICIASSYNINPFYCFRQLAIWLHFSFYLLCVMRSVWIIMMLLCVVNLISTQTLAIDTAQDWKLQCSINVWIKTLFFLLKIEDLVFTGMNLLSMHTLYVLNVLTMQRNINSRKNQKYSSY